MNNITIPALKGAVINTSKAITSQAPAAIANALVSLHVDGKPVQVNQGATLLDAVNKCGSHVPTLCYHPEFEPRAVCRMCLVNVAGSSKPVPACRTLAEEGQSIITNSKELKSFRHRDLQFLLNRHPNDCMKCEVSGNCKLQSMVQEEQVEEMWPEHKSPRGSPGKLSYQYIISINEH